MKLRGIQLRLMSIVMVLVSIPMIFLSFTIFHVVSNQLKERLVQEESLAVKEEVAILEAQIEKYKSLTLALKSLPPAQGMVRAQATGIDPTDGSSYDEWVNRYQSIFKTMIRANSDIRQIRYIDEHGIEIIDVYSKDDTVSISETNELQDKSTKDYIVKTTNLKDDEVYITSINLNEEHGQIEAPHTSVLRMITPVFNEETGERKGSIVVNLFANTVLLLQKDRSIEREIIVTDEEGYFLLHTDTEKEFGRELGHNANFFTEQPELIENTRKSDWRNHYDPEESHFRIWRKLFYNPEDTSRYLIIFHVVNEADLLYAIGSLGDLTVIIAAVTLLVSLVVTYSITKSITSPIVSLTRSAESIASGNFETQINVSPYGDETTTLGEELKRMQERFHHMYKNMEKEIQERTQELENTLSQEKRSKIAMLNIMEDLENTKRSLEVQKNELKESEERFRGAFETSPIGIALVSLDGKWLKVNKGMCDIVGYKQEELLNMSFQEITHPDDLQEDLNHVYNLIQGKQKSYEMEKRYIHKLGYEIWALLSVSLIRNTKGEPLYFVSQVIDITQRKRVEEAKSNFVSLASHQLRTPLTALKWIIEAFSKGKLGKLNDKQAEMIADARTSTLHMSETINTMLMLSRIEAGKLKVEKAKINVGTLIQEIYDEQEVQTKAKSQSASIDIEPNLELTSDASILKEIVRNLLSNAIKYTPENGEINISAIKEGNSMTITVTDSGFGIPTAEKDKIFTKFFRASNVLNKETEGTGLGLYLVHSLVRMLQGSIRFESTEGKGTTFFVTIPLTPPSS